MDFLDPTNGPATVIPAQQIIPDRFRRTPWKLSGGLTDFTVSWLNPTAPVARNDFIKIGFDFESDRPFSVSAAWWTWNNVNIGNINPGSLSWQTSGYLADFNSWDPGPLRPQDPDWQAWNDDENASNFQVTNQQVFSAPNAMEIDDLDDAVHQFADFEDGQSLFSTWVYIPHELDDSPWLILLNEYPTTYGPGWSLALEFDGHDNVIRDEGTGAERPLIRGDFFEVVVDIDIDLDQQTIQIAGEDFLTKSWTAGIVEGGAPRIAAVDLWAAGSNHAVFYDDMVLVDITPEGCEGQSPCPEDVDGNGTVNFGDILRILGVWGPCE